MFIKCAEGCDTFCIAGTGFGKSLVFALLAIAVELAGSKGTVVVVCPLKALKIDQVRWFDMANGVRTSSGKNVHISAVAINEDNKDSSLFQKLEDGAYRICYSSPKMLLCNNEFKKLFRKEKFQWQITVIAVDEAHIKAGRTHFVETTMNSMPCDPTDTFEVIYDTLGMGMNRDFWGIDMGTNQLNLRLWVRPIEYSDLADLFIFLPENPSSVLDFDKTIFYFKSRALARKACHLCRHLIPMDF
ncbi:hypothetical protein AX14_006503, partial [Amanita brunnescens Koide BX004]